MRIVLVLAVCLYLSGCACCPEPAPDFSTVQSGKIAPDQTREFADCVLEGFKKVPHSTRGLSDLTRSSSGYSVSYYPWTPDRSKVRVDVLDNGQVQLLEDWSGLILSTQGEKDAFAACLRRF